MALIALAGSTGLEPATSDVTGRRSNQTELTPQAAIRLRSLLRGLVYTESVFVRKNFFSNNFARADGCPDYPVYLQDDMS